MLVLNTSYLTYAQMLLILTLPSRLVIEMRVGWFPRGPRSEGEGHEG
jgi:hypothetical protein